MTTKLLVKKVLSFFLFHCGVFSLLEHQRLRNKAFVLMYHRVLGSEDLQAQYVQPGMYVLRSSFESQIAFLKKNYRVLFLEELLKKAKHREDIGGCCAITFDDGWLDNFTNAFPVLKKYQAAATIFLATAFVGTDRLFWPDEMCAYLKCSPLARQKYRALPPSVLKFHGQIKKHASTRGGCFFEKAIEVLKGFSPYERNEILEYYRRFGNSENSPRQMMGWKNVIEMGNSGLVRFGAHTAGHEILDQLPPIFARSEISQSKDDIERRLGAKVTTFAYPNGNHNKDVREIVKGCGFECAVTTSKGFLGRDTLPMEVPRIGIHEDVSTTIPMFRSRILFQNF